MDKLIGRAEEMRELESFLADSSVRGCVVYGVRQVGKSILLRSLASARRSVYMQFSLGSESAVVGRVMGGIRRSFPDAGEASTFRGLLDVLEAICSEVPTLVAIDGYSCLSASVKDADRMLKGFSETVLAATGSKLIVCGSPTSFIMDIVSNRGNPLHGILGCVIEVRPLSFEDTCLFHPGMDDADQKRMYMVFGGMPMGHLEFDGPTFRDVVETRFLARGLPLCRVAKARIGPDPSGDYEAIVRAIAAGKTHPKDIVECTGIPKSTCGRRLKNLEGKGVVGRLVSSRRPSFRLEDGFVDFWYTVFDVLDEFCLPDEPSERYALVKDAVDGFMARRSETISSGCTGLLCTSDGKSQ